MGTALLAAAGVILLLLIVSGFFSGSETALTAVSRGRMHQLEKDGSKSARDVNHLVGDRERVIGAILLGNTFLNILASSFATWVLESQFGERAVAIATAVMTILILMFAEVLPKTLAIARTDRFALAVAQPMRLIVGVLAPVVGAVQWLVWRMLRLVGIRQEESGELMDSHEEIRGTVNLHHEEGAVGREHRDMITGVLDLRELQIADVMVHRRSMVAVDADLPPAQIFEELIAAEHTRTPVYRGTPENIIGVLRAAEVVREYAQRAGNFDGFDILALMHEPWFVPDTTTLEEQLRAFRAQRSHFAFVVDEYGALQGIVTREDILDEILGDIPDEGEAESRGNIRKQKDGSYIVEGRTPIRDLNRELDWNLPDEEATTIAGLVIHEARTIPEAKQRFAFYGYTFEILRRQRNQITALRVTPPSVPATAQPA
ncbi:MAG TPA: HlyC/CorC family transporter [Rhizomicrobium sp.]|nr:HlyC/CorC family transporter [Rhizomicrobium sp.]